MTLEKALENLKPFIGKDNSKFEIQFNYIKNNFTSKDDIKKIDDFIRNGLFELTNNLKQFNADTSIKLKLKSITKMISTSYIAKEYFNKSRHWLYQRISGNLVNGKPAKFSQEELVRLNFALKDISKKIGSVSVL